EPSRFRFDRHAGSSAVCRPDRSHLKLWEGGLGMRTGRGGNQERSNDGCHIAKHQFSVGRLTLSITSTSTGAFVASSLRPSCSCIAVNNEDTSDAASALSPPQRSSKTCPPSIRVRSTTGRSVLRDNVCASCAIEVSGLQLLI